MKAARDRVDLLVKSVSSMERLRSFLPLMEIMLRQVQELREHDADLDPELVAVEEALVAAFEALESAVNVLMARMDVQWNLETKEEEDDDAGS